MAKFNELLSGVAQNETTNKKFQQSKLFGFLMITIASLKELVSRSFVAEYVKDGLRVDRFACKTEKIDITTVKHTVVENDEQATENGNLPISVYRRIKFYKDEAGNTGYCGVKRDSYVSTTAGEKVSIIQTVGLFKENEFVDTDIQKYVEPVTTKQPTPEEIAAFLASQAK